MSVGLSVVCGASGGLGPAVLDALAPTGDTLVGVASQRSERSRLQDLRADVRWELIDLTDPSAVADLWRRLDSQGEVHRLVNVTGGFTAGRLLESPPEVVRAMFGVNLDAAWWSSREAARLMVAGGGGAIVNVASQAGITLAGGSAAYTVAKAALIAMTRVLATELTGTGVRVNAIAPRTIDTPANRTWMGAADIAGAASPERVAAVIASLCDGPMSAVSGAILPVTGDR
ncbi:MAG: SDR family oxidoreductase [Candidatus Dormiibacterota bacterium]